MASCRGMVPSRMGKETTRSKEGHEARLAQLEVRDLQSKAETSMLSISDPKCPVCLRGRHGPKGGGKSAVKIDSEVEALPIQDYL